MEKKIKATLKAKRIFKKITTVTFFQIYDITSEGEFKQVSDADGKPIKFERRTAAERYCEKHDVYYIELKHIFYR